MGVALFLFFLRGVWHLFEMASPTTTMEELMRRYNLRDVDVNRQVTPEHIDRISYSYCREWGRLPPFLRLESIIAEDINRLPISESEKKRMFFSKWVELKGSGATYKELIKALLEIDRVNDAEVVCRLIQPPQRTLEPAPLPRASNPHSSGKSGSLEREVPNACSMGIHEARPLFASPGIMNVCLARYICQSVVVATM